MEYDYVYVSNAILAGHELHFFYNDDKYSISYNDDGWYLTKFYKNHEQSFNTAKSLLENARIDGLTLEEIWNRVQVDVLF